MIKENVFLKVDNVAEDSLIVSSISVSAWHDRECTSMIDEHLTELFEELIDLEIYDLCEGEMEYDGDLTVEELREELFNMGFQIIA